MISANPVSLVIVKGSTNSSVITLRSLNGLQGVVTLKTAATPSTGLTPSLNSTSLSLAAGGTKYAALTVSASAAGVYNVMVNATFHSGSLNFDLNRTLSISSTVVIRADFMISVSPIGQLNNGTFTTSTITLTGLNKFNGTITLSASVSPTTGLAATLIGPTVTLNSTIATGTATLRGDATVLGTYAVTITGKNGTSGTPLTRTSQLTITVVDFTISSSSQTIACLAGTSCTTTITVTGLNSFSSTVKLTTTPSTGLTADLDITSITGSGTATLTVSAATPSAYTVTVKGTSSNLVHSTTITVNVGDFALTLGQSSMTLSQGSTATSTVSLSIQGPSSGTVTISLLASASPSGPSLSLDKSILDLAPAGSASATLTINLGTASPGSYTITVNATLGQLTHTKTIAITITKPAITIVSGPTLSTTSATLGQQVLLTIDISNPSTVGLNFTLTLDANGVTVASKQVALAPGQDSGIITLTWDTTNYQAGSVTLNVRFVGVKTTGASPVSVDLVQSSTPAGSATLSAPSGGLSLPGGNLLWIIIAVLVVVIVLAVVLVRRRRIPAA
jgi:hypothetical protein